jgi:TolA-binding protein
MKNFKKVTCSVLAALTIFSSSAAISNVATGKTFTNSNTVEAASTSPVDELNRIIDDYTTTKNTYQAKLDKINSQIKSTKDKAKLDELKAKKKKYESIIASYKSAIASLKAQMPKMYFKKYTGSSNSIVDALKGMGVRTDFNSLKYIATANKISNYTGTAAQNTKMLNLLKQGKLQNPDAPITVPAVLG